MAADTSSSQTKQKLAIVIDSYYSNVKRLDSNDKHAFVVHALEKTILPRFRKKFNVLSDTIFISLWSSDSAAESIIDHLLHSKEHYDWYVAKYGAESWGENDNTYHEYIDELLANAKGQSYYRKHIVSCIRETKSGHFRQSLYNLFLKHITHLDMLLDEMIDMHAELCALLAKDEKMKKYLPNMFDALSDESHEYRDECERVLSMYDIVVA